MAGHFNQFDRTEKPDASVPLRKGHWSTDGLVGCWDMRDGAGLTARDASGNGNDGTLTNMDANTDWVVGDYGRALDFDGTNDYVTAGTSALYSGDKEFCVRVIAKTDAPGADKWETLAGKWAAGNLSWVIYRHRTNHTFSAWLRNGGSSFQANGSIPLTAGETYDVWLWSDGETLKLFVNGELDAQNTSPTNFTSQSVSSDLRIGASGYGEYFDGPVYRCEYRAYAPTDTEIAALYANPNLIYQPHRMFVPGAAGVGGGTIPLFYYYYAMMRSQ